MFRRVNRDNRHQNTDPFSNKLLRSTTVLINLLHTTDYYTYETYNNEDLELKEQETSDEETWSNSASGAISQSDKVKLLKFPAILIT